MDRVGATVSTFVCVNMIKFKQLVSAGVDCGYRGIRGKSLCTLPGQKLYTILVEKYYGHNVITIASGRIRKLNCFVGGNMKARQKGKQNKKFEFVFEIQDWCSRLQPSLFQYRILERMKTLSTREEFVE